MRAVSVALTWAWGLCSLLNAGGVEGMSLRGGRPSGLMVRDEQPLQDIVTWDEDSIFIHGERVFLYSGEVHPYRLPVPDLHLDIFQKIKALGYNCVSFYVDWALLEGEPGVYRAEGIFDLQPFFDAAQKAGIWLIARPGPYINAEVSGGGFPGWIQRINGTLRTAAQDFLNATDLYMSEIGKTIASAQITNGGPIILVQPENEYTQALSSIKPFPDPAYMTYIYAQLRSAGIVVPLISNDASPKGYNAPGQEAPVDIYGHDGYPLGFDCANPTVWPDGKLPTNWRDLHEEQSPTTPYSILEFQAGSFDPWGGPGFEKCATLVGAEFQRVFYKQLYSFGVTVLNLYMTWGGTNWGNLGHPGGYTSYDYAAIIRENRLVDREKYSEQKLQANFFAVSPSYLTATRGNASTTSHSTSPDLAVTPAYGKDGSGYYFVRHEPYNSRDETQYKLTVKTSAFGDIEIPQYNGSEALSLNGRDAKVHVTDYDVGGATVVYSTAEIFTWQKYEDKTVLVVYGGPGETHELVLAVTGLEVLEGKDEVKSISTRGYTLLNFKSEAGKRKVARVGVSAPYIYVYMLDRNEAYNYWTVPISSSSPTNATTTSSLILKAGYLVRTASLSSTSTIALTGDLNTTTTPLEVIGFPPSTANSTSLTFNNIPFPLSISPKTSYSLQTTLTHTPPAITIPKLAELEWYKIDSLPELGASYSDSAWVDADLATTTNTLKPLLTPTSLYGADYGFHTGSLVFRGHFTATGEETSFYIATQGGSAFGHSVFLNQDFVGSWTGYDAAIVGNGTYALPRKLIKGDSYVITVVIDNMGLDENWTIGTETMKNPRGILDYAFPGAGGNSSTKVAWKITGNLGAEKYKDVLRGPLNEGALWAERMGLHLPGALAATRDSLPWVESGPPLSSSSSSATGNASANAPGISFFATTFDLDISDDYDVPLSFVFANASSTAYRAQLFVNGFHYGKFVSNVGPQTVFPVPEGILDYRGENYLGVTVWVLEESGVGGGNGTALGGLELVADGGVIWSGKEKVRIVEGERYVEREGAY